MKYYLRQPLLGYIVLPIIGAVLSGIIVIPTCSVFYDDQPLYQIANSGILLLLYLFFLCWYIYANRFRDYIELHACSITFAHDERRKKQSITVEAKDVQLLEFVADGDKEAEFYMIYAYDKEPISFESFQVPPGDVADFCRRNNIRTEKVVLKYRNIAVQKTGKRYFTLYDHKTKKKIRIRTTEIRQIEFVRLSPLSVANRYYRLTTTDDKQYNFGCIYTEEKSLEEYCRKQGFSIVDKNEY